MNRKDDPGKVLIDIGIGAMATIGIIGGLWALYYWVFALSAIANG
jgi:hypothetical protein